MDSKQQDRYQRWQDYRITQLSFSINLFLGFAVASLAYVINLKLGSKPHNSIPLIPIIICWSTSAALGCIATLSKLTDYRYTAQKIICKNRFNSFMAKHCGKITWGCFWAQVLSYALGAYFFITCAINA